MRASQTADIVKMLDDCVGITQQSRPERLAMEQQWLTTMLYFKGQQRLEWVDNRLYNRGYNDDDEQPHYKANYMGALMISAAARILNVEGEFDVRPPRGDMRARELAGLSKRVFEHQKEVTDFKWLQEQSTIWKTCIGTSVYKTIWDPLIGDPTRYYWNDKQSKAVIPETMLTSEQIAQKTADGLFEDHSPGDVRIDVLSPFTFFPDWSARGAGIRHCQWAAEKHYVDIEVIAERWNKDPDDIKPATINQGLLNYEDAMQAAFAGSWLAPFSYTVPKDKLNKRTLYVEYWRRPSKMYPKGMRVCFAGDMILNADDITNPYAADKTGWTHLPYTPDYWVPDPSRFWGKGMGEDLMTPQFYTNEARSQKVYFMRIHGMPNTYVGRDSGLDTENMEAGGRVYGVAENSAFKVQHGPTPNMPAEVAVLDSQLIQDMQFIASQSEIDGNKLPGQLRSGAAIQQMQQDRFTGLTIPARCTLRACRDTGRQLLALGKMYYGPNRTMQYLGEANEWVVEEFDGANLHNDVVIIGDQGVADASGAQRQEMMDAISAGAFNPQFDAETKALILSGLHFDTSEEFVKQKLQAKRACEREIQMVLKDPMKYAQGGLPVLDWQDHELYMATLRAFFYTPEFEKLDPITQSILNTNFAGHQKLLMQEQLAQAQMLEATKGAPGQPGMASQPRS